MDDIAAAAKLSKGGIYHYFSSKTEVLYFILDNFMDVVLKELGEELDKHDNELERVRGLIFCHVDQYPKYLAEAKTLFREVQNLPPKYYKKIIAKGKGIQPYYTQCTCRIFRSFHEKKPGNGRDLHSPRHVQFNLCL